MENDLVAKAKAYAENFHKEHKRISGNSYVKHIEGTIKNLLDNQVTDEVTLASAYLTHVLSFDPSKDKEMEDIFGTEVIQMLQKYRKLTNNPIKDIHPTEMNEIYILQAYMHLAEDYKILLIRLASKVADSETLVNLPKEHAEKVANKALYLYAPLARLFSFSSFATKLENNAFKVLYPAEYIEVSKKIKKVSSKANLFFDGTIPPLKQLLEESGIKVDIKKRIKHLYGIYRKSQYLKSKGINVGKNYEGVYDVVGIRIIVQTINDCYKTEDILKQLWDYISEERDDFIQTPRHSGYRAIHNTFKTSDMTFEAQILTEEMYHFNEFGPARHSIYKIMDKDKSKNSKDDQKLKEELLQYLNKYTDATNNKDESLIKSIYAFTPKGDILELPKGSNLIDFAYAIHVQIGHGATYGIVNGKQEGLAYEIKTGDRIEIKTTKKLPSRDWLKMVKTTKAKNVIRKTLFQNDIKS